MNMMAEIDMLREGEMRAQMTIVIDMLDGEDIPRRGDLRTNVGNKRERTCFVLR